MCYTNQVSTTCHISVVTLGGTPCELPGMLRIYSEASLVLTCWHYHAQNPDLVQILQNCGPFPLLIRKPATPSRDNQEEITWHCKRDEGSHAENLYGKADTVSPDVSQAFSLQIQATQHPTWDSGAVRGASGVRERPGKSVDTRTQLSLGLGQGMGTWGTRKRSVLLEILEVF